MKHKFEMDVQEFQFFENAKMYNASPKKLMIIVDLPELRSANDAVLDVQKKFLRVKSEAPAKYLLELPLPCAVDADKRSMRFNEHKKLTVTLPVIHNVTSPGDTIEDSGVDSDNSNSLNEGSCDNSCG